VQLALLVLVENWVVVLVGQRLQLAGVPAWALKPSLYWPLGHLTALKPVAALQPGRTTTQQNSNNTQRKFGWKGRLGLAGCNV
jgi:hypothetical protein